MTEEEIKAFEASLADTVQVLTVQFEITIDGNTTEEVACTALAKALSDPRGETAEVRVEAKLQALAQMAKLIEWIGPIEVVKTEVAKRPEED